MAARYGLTDEEVADGFVLTCQSVPLDAAARWITTLKVPRMQPRFAPQARRTADSTA